MSVPKNLFLNFSRNLSKLGKKQIINPSHSSELPVFDYLFNSHDRNRVYVWGNFQTGALGSPRLKVKENMHQIQHFRCPRRLFFAEKNDVKLAAAGFGFTLYATKNKVFGTGLNTDSQIGYHEVSTDKPLEILFAPMPIALNTSENVEILKLSAGRAHTAVLTNEGLFMFGNNAYGQCGRRIIDNENYMGSRFVNHIETIEGKAIVDVTCGQDHSLVITSDGSVYGCGWGADGQTGLGHYKTTSEFTKVKGDIENEKIKKISSRCDFVLALNGQGQVFGWGNTEYNQIKDSQGSQQMCNPKHLDFFKDIVDVATGGSHCLALTESGKVYVWGFGLLGLGPNTQETSVPLEIPSQLFGFNEFNPTNKVIAIESGLSHFGAVTNDGNLYMWGRNRSCCLGVDFDKDQYFPYKVSLAASVTRVFCGLDHSLALCKSFISKNKN